MVVFSCDDTMDDGSPAKYLQCISYASWTTMGWQLLGSLVVWVFGIGVVAVLARMYRGLPTPDWVHMWFGSPGVKPENQLLNANLRLMQLICSSIVMITWIVKSYLREAPPGIQAIEFLCCMVFLLHLVYALIGNGFSVAYALSYEGWLDAFTITPLLMQLGGGSYLTLAYLRTYRMNTAFVRLCATGVLDEGYSEITLVYIKKLVEFFMVITYIACSTFVLEALGDVPGFEDKFIDTAMGSVSFFQSCYYAFMLMSTVGFGDFSPQTVFNRFFTFFFTVGGVVFFSSAAGDILSMAATVSGGGGAFRPKKKKLSPEDRGHILVVGGGVSGGNRTSIECFLRMLCRDSTTPEIVIMGDSISDDLKAMCKEPWALNFGVQFFKGSCLKRSDLNRVKAGETSMVFVIADFNNPDTYTEDHNNVLASAAFQTQFPGLPYRLMAVEVQHMELAAHMGLNMFNCYAIEGLKAAILASSLKCPGFATVMLNLGLPPIAPPKNSDPKVSEWMKEYIASTKLSTFGFRPAPSFYGKTFKEAARELGNNNIAALAVQVDGSLRVNPGESAVISEESVIFAMCAQQSDLDPLALNGSAAVSVWLKQFGDNRSAGYSKRKTEALKLDQGNAFGGNRGKSFGAGIEMTEVSPGSGASSGGGVGMMGMVNRSRGESMARRNHQKVQLPSMRKLMAAATTTKTAAKDKKSLQAASSADLDAVALTAEAEEELHYHPLQPSKEILDAGGHAVILLLYEQSSQAPPLFAQVDVIVNNLRATSDSPVVIVGPSHDEATDGLLNRIRSKYSTRVEGSEDVPNVFFVEGDPLSPLTLMRAGLPTAEQVATLAPVGKVVYSDDDCTNLLAQAVLDKKLREWGRADLFATFDWVSPNSFPLMVDPPSPFATAKAALPDFTNQDRAYAAKELRCHYRYASGRVVPKPYIAGCYSSAYYTPGVLELFEALIDPSKTDQVSMAWLVPLPESALNKPYAEYAKSLLDGGAVPMGVMRSGGPVGYVALATPFNQDLVLKPGDAVYALASMEWAQENLGNFSAPEAAAAAASNAPPADTWNPIVTVVATPDSETTTADTTTATPPLSTTTSPALSPSASTDEAAAAAV